MTRVELVTSPLPRVRSTTELHGQGTLQWAELDSNQRRHSQRIYSPPPLTTRAPTPIESTISNRSSSFVQLQPLFLKNFFWLR